MKSAARTFTSPKKIAHMKQKESAQRTTGSIQITFLENTKICLNKTMQMWIRGREAEVEAT